MKTNKLLSYITLGVLFSGVAFADGGVLAKDGAETQSTDAMLVGDVGPKEISGGIGSTEERLDSTTMGQSESSDVSDTGDGKLQPNERLFGTDQGTTDTGASVQDSDRKFDIKDRKGRRGVAAEDNSKDSQDELSSEEVVVTGSKK